MSMLVVWREVGIPTRSKSHVVVGDDASFVAIYPVISQSRDSDRRRRRRRREHARCRRTDLSDSFQIIVA